MVKKIKTIEDLLEVLKEPIQEVEIETPLKDKDTAVFLLQEKCNYLLDAITEADGKLHPDCSIYWIIKDNTENKMNGIKSLRMSSTLSLLDSKRIMYNFNHHFNF